MPTIPSFKSKARIQAPSGGQAASPAAARRQGQDLANLGGQITNLGINIGNFEEKVRRQKQALSNKEASDQAILETTKASGHAKTNKEASADGSTYQKHFMDVYGPSKEAYLEGVDPEFRAGAENAMRSKEVLARAKLLDDSRVKLVEHNYQRQDDMINRNSAIIQNDPTKAIAMMNESASVIDESNLPEDQRNKLKSVMKQEYGMSATQAYMDTNNYEAARQVMKGGVGQFFDTKERESMLDKIDREEMSHLDNKFMKESRGRARSERKEKEQQDKLFSNSLQKLVTATSSADKDEIISQAEQAVKAGVMKPSTFKALLADQEIISKDTSSQVRGNLFLKSLKGASADSIKKEVEKKMEEGDITHQDGAALINSVMTREKKEKDDPMYKQRMKTADKFIKAAVVPTGKDAIGNLIHGSDDKLKLAEIHSQFDEYIARGIQPDRASRMAIGKVVGAQRTVFISGLSMKDQRDADSLDAAIRRSMSYYAANRGKISEANAIKFVDNAKLMKQKLEGMRAWEEFESIMKEPKVEKDGK